MPLEREPLFEIARRTFDTPEFRGIEFIETEARSVINRVPGNFLPFDWTINPYRGCTHACSYCTDADTPVLMADGRTRPIADLVAGDAIFGTRRVGAYRRFARTTVLDRWSVVKPGYRVVLEDGTEVVVSGDHRFLTNRGWKYVTGVAQGSGRRPFLTTNNHLLGTGAFPDAPIHNRDYRRGYLCGMIRGDGTLGSYSYDRPGRRHGDVHRFRLALVDLEGLHRTRGYLDALDVPTTEFQFAAAAGTHAAVTAIRTSARASVERIAEVCRWLAAPSLSWVKGFLAGIFDAEGSYSRGILRGSRSVSRSRASRTACARSGCSGASEPPSGSSSLSIRRSHASARSRDRPSRTTRRSASPRSSRSASTSPWSISPRVPGTSSRTAS
jgi:hypothetical protein